MPIVETCKLFTLDVKVRWTSFSCWLSGFVEEFLNSTRGSNAVFEMASDKRSGKVHHGDLDPRLKVKALSTHPAALHVNYMLLVKLVESRTSLPSLLSLHKFLLGIESHHNKFYKLQSKYKYLGDRTLASGWPCSLQNITYYHYIRCYIHYHQYQHRHNRVVYSVCDIRTKHRGCGNCFMLDGRNPLLCPTCKLDLLDTNERSNQGATRDRCKHRSNISKKEYIVKMI